MRKSTSVDRALQSGADDRRRRLAATIAMTTSVAWDVLPERSARVPAGYRRGWGRHGIVVTSDDAASGSGTVLRCGAE